MASHRIGGLAVALGIGSAVVAGHGVAAAQPSDGSSTNPSSTGSSTSKGGDASAPSASSTDKGPATESAPGTSAPESEKDNAETETTTATGDSSADEDKTDGATTKKKGFRGSRPTGIATDPVVRSTRIAEVTRVASAARAKTATAEVADVRPALRDVSPAPSPTPTAEVAAVSVSAATEAEPRQQVSTTKPQDPVEVVTVALSRAVSALLSPTTDDAPTAPLESAAMFTLAAASRRELIAPPDVDQAADPVTTSLTTDDSLAATDEPVVVATGQTAPLAWLQQVPVIGPTLVTPIVTALHLVPIVSDVLHPLVGYPVQPGLPAGAPVSRDVKVISSDGTPIYVHFMPATGLLANQKAPTILDGPGLVLPGATNVDGFVLEDVVTDATGLMSVGTLRQAGYNVVTWDPRGEWNSGGVLELNSAEFEGEDMAAIISWIATQPEARLDAPGDPRLGMVGVSYGGGIQLVTAANDARVDAIVPAITYHRLDTALYKNEAFKTSWATLLATALTVTARINPQILPAAIYGDLTGTMSQSDLDLLLDRNPDVGLITAPTLLIQGTADTIFSLQEADDTAQTMIGHGVPTKVVWFCGGHGFCANNPVDLRDGALIKLRTLQWLDRYVKGSSADTGPQFEWVDQHGQWFSSKGYPVSPGSSIVTSTSDRTLPLLPYLGGSGIPFVPFAFEAPIALNVDVPPATSTTYLVGAPKLTLTYSGTGTSDHVYAQFVDNSTGLVLSSLATPIPVTLDGDSHTLTVPLEPVAHTLRPGESVTLQLVGSAGLYERITPSLGDLKVSSMQLTLPTADPTKVGQPTS